jgi:cell wall assembly regulator SMI1
MVDISGTGPTLTEDEVKNFESGLGVALPADYRAFLLAHNGGTPTPDTIDVPPLLESPTDVQVLFGIGRKVMSSDLSWNLQAFADRWPKRSALPIACDSGGNLFCLELSGSNLGRVIYYDLNAPVCTGSVVAPTFQSFLNRLRHFGH